MFFLVATLVIASPVNSDPIPDNDYIFNVGDIGSWHLFVDTTGEPTCGAWSKFDDGTELHFLPTSSKTVVLFRGKPFSYAELGKKYSDAITFNTVTVSGSMGIKTTTSSAVHFWVEPEAARSALAQANSITLATHNGLKSKYDLVGLRVVFDGIEKCRKLLQK